MGLKLEYREVGFVGSYSLLADVSDVVKEWNPDVSLNSVQREDLAQTPGQKAPAYRQPLGNIVTRLQMDISATKTTLELASQFARETTIALLGTKVNLKMTKGTDVEFYPNAVFSRCAHRNGGATVEFNLSAESDLVTADEPA